MSRAGYKIDGFWWRNPSGAILCQKHWRLFLTSANTTFVYVETCPLTSRLDLVQMEFSCRTTRRNSMMLWLGGGGEAPRPDKVLLLLLEIAIVK